MIHRGHFLILSVILAVVGASCSETTAPSSPAVPTPPISQRTFSGLQGNIDNTVFEGIAGATVEVLDGARAGASVQTEAGGRYSIPGEFAENVTLRVTKDGFIPFQKRVTLQPMFNNASLARFDLNLELPAPIAIETGDSWMTFAGASECGFPEAVRGPITISKFTGYATTSGYSFNVPGSIGFGMGVAGNRVFAEIDIPVVVPLVPAGALTFTAIITGDAEPSPSSVAVPFDGRATFCRPDESGGTTCSACRTGRLSFTRR